MASQAALSTNIYGLCCDKDGVYVLDCVVSSEGWAGMPTRILAFNHGGEAPGGKFFRRRMTKITPDEYPLINEAMQTTVGIVLWEKRQDFLGAREAEGPPYALRLPNGERGITPAGNGSFFRPLASNSLSVADGMLTAVVNYAGDPPVGSKLQFFRLKTDGAMPSRGILQQRLWPSHRGRARSGRRRESGWQMALP